MRIIAGEHRGARIFAPPGRDTRPTSDRAREAAFNLIGPVDDAEVLDLFAGRAIDRNLEKLRLTGAIVLQRDALQVLAEEAARGRRYDLVLVDPPYEMFKSLQNGLSRHLPAVLAPDGIVVVETSAHEPEPE